MNTGYAPVTGLKMYYEVHGDVPGRPLVPTEETLAPLVQVLARTRAWVETEARCATDRQREHFRMQHCGFIFQEHNLLPSLTARQQLEMVLRWGIGASAREARARADAMLALLGLARKGHLRPLELSGGEKQRVAIGRALIKEPTFCFADEPTSALDWTHGELIVELLRNAAHDFGRTVLVVGHDWSVPGLIASLGGPQLPNICPSVFDKLFVLTSAQGKASLIQAHYGEPSPDECK